MAGERRGGLEITSSKTSPGGASPTRPPGEVLFDLVFSNESLWSTIDPHAAQTIVEQSVEQKGVVDLGDLIREFVARKTAPDLAKGLVLAFAMELARSGVAVRLPAELQSLDRTTRQKLVDVFRAGQKGADEATKTMAQPSGPTRPPVQRTSSGGQAPAPARPPPQRTASGSQAPSPARASTPPAAAAPEAALDDWSKGLRGAVDPKAAERAASGPNRRAPGESSGPNRPPRAPTDPGRERSRTNIERPRPSSGALDVSGLVSPARLAMIGVAALFFVVGLFAGPRTPPIVVEEQPLPPDIPCARLERNGPHLFCVVDVDRVEKRLTLEDIARKKAALLEAARRRGHVSVTFFNPDLSRFDPTPAPVEVRAVVAKPVERQGEAGATTTGGYVDIPSESDEEGQALAPAEEAALEVPIVDESGAPIVRKRRGHEHDEEHGEEHDEAEQGHVEAPSSTRGRAQVIEPPPKSEKKTSKKRR